jgi:hypothetical protein
MTRASLQKFPEMKVAGIHLMLSENLLLSEDLLLQVSCSYLQE